MGSFVRLEVKERIAYLSLERPKAYNALSRQAVDELDEALEEIASCGSISVLGNGGFNAGGSGKVFIQPYI